MYLIKREIAGMPVPASSVIDAGMADSAGLIHAYTFIKRRIVMKTTANTKSLLFLALFSMAGAHAASAADSRGDAQQQARSLLGGTHPSEYGRALRTAAATSAASASSPVDAQQQARQMILGRPVVRAAGAPAVANAGFPSAAPDSRKVDRSGDEQGRRMIIRSVPTMRAGD
jgi:hypothetical protein